jgi:hypothetical protein
MIEINLQIAPLIVDSPIVGKFRLLVEGFASILHDEGIAIEPYVGDFPRQFCSLDGDQQGAVLSSFERYLQVCAETIASGYHLKSDRQLLWQSLKNFGLCPTSDMMEHIEDGDLIEIYTNTGIQIFRNARLFPHCSYSLDDLLCKPWWQLFRRDQAVTDEILAMTRDLYSGRNPNTQIYTMAPFYLEEVESPRLYRCLVQNKIMSPLRDKQDSSSIAGVTVAKILESASMAPVTGTHGAKSLDLGSADSWKL